MTPARIHCRTCGRDTEFTSEEMLFRCGHCGSGEITLTAGKEFHIDSIEATVESADDTGKGKEGTPWNRRA